jgi:hypothetical protein
VDFKGLPTDADSEAEFLYVSRGACEAWLLLYNMQFNEAEDADLRLVRRAYFLWIFNNCTERQRGSAGEHRLEGPARALSSTKTRASEKVFVDIFSSRVPVPNFVRGVSLRFEYQNIHFTSTAQRRVLLHTLRKPQTNRRKSAKDKHVSKVIVCIMATSGVRRLTHIRHHARTALRCKGEDRRSRTCLVAACDLPTRQV